MSTNPPTVISENNLSVAWAKALLEAMKRSHSELAPLALSVGGFSGAPAEDVEISRIFDAARLNYRGKEVFSAAVSASTIFPWKFWRMNSSPDCAVLSARYLAEILPRLKRGIPRIDLVLISSAWLILVKILQRVSPVKIN